MTDYGIRIDGGWFDEEKHIYRCEQGIIRPSTTQVFDLLGMTDFSAVSPERIEWKREYGNAVHAGVQYLCAGDLDWDSLDEQIIPAVTGIEQFLRHHQFEYEYTEERKVRNLFGMRYGTTLDYQGWIVYQGKRRRVIADWKTGSKVSPTWRWQLGGYYVGQEKGDWIGVIGQVDMDGKVTPHWVLDMEAAKREFQILLSAAILKCNAGLAKVGK